MIRRGGAEGIVALAQPCGIVGTVGEEERTHLRKGMGGGTNGSSHTRTSTEFLQCAQHCTGATI